MVAAASALTWLENKVSWTQIGLSWIVYGTEGSTCSFYLGILCIDCLVFDGFSFSFQREREERRAWIVVTIEWQSGSAFKWLQICKTVQVYSTRDSPSLQMMCAWSPLQAYTCIFPDKLPAAWPGTEVWRGSSWCCCLYCIRGEMVHEKCPRLIPTIWGTSRAKAEMSMMLGGIKVCQGGIPCCRVVAMRHCYHLKKPQELL